MTAKWLQQQEFVKVRAERKFREIAYGIAQGITLEEFENLARHNITIGHILEQTGRVVPKPSVMARPGIDYLVSLPDDKLLGLLNDVIPEYVLVLKKYPDYSKAVIKDLKALVK